MRAASASASPRPAAVIVSDGRERVAAIVVWGRNVNQHYEQNATHESVSIRREDESRNSSCGWIRLTSSNPQWTEERRLTV